MASPAVQAAVANVSRALLAGAVHNEVHHWKLRVGVEALLAVLLVGLVAMLLAASWFYLLEFASPKVAALGVAGEIAILSLLTWVAARLLLRSGP